MRGRDVFVLSWLFGVTTMGIAGGADWALAWLVGFPCAVVGTSALVIRVAVWRQRRHPVIDPDWSEFYRTASRFSSFAESPYDWEREGR